MKIILGIVIIFVAYEMGYSIGYRHCIDYMRGILEECENQQDFIRTDKKNK